MSKLIPFWLMPGSWGLKGQAYDVAEAYYLYEGEELERRLVAITVKDEKERQIEILHIDRKYGKISPYDCDVAVANLKYEGTGDLKKRRLLEIDRQHDRIDDYEFDVALAKLQNTDIELKIRLIEIEAQHGKITEIAAQKEIATLNGEPWVGVVEDRFDPEKGIDGFTMKLDWNDLWIDALRDAGYDGYDEDDVVRAWFQDVSQEVSSIEDMKVIAFPNNREGS